MSNEEQNVNFAKPMLADSAVLKELNDILIRRFGNNIWLKGMYNDEVIYIGCDKHHLIKIKIEVVRNIDVNL